LMKIMWKLSYQIFGSLFLGDNLGDSL